MPSYRFCRPDDIPYLVRAIEECYRVHFPDAPEMTVDRFRDEMKTLDLWPSNSMVASSERGPVGVLIGTKRSDAVRILRLGIHPDHQRRGHALHMITSLGQKLAVLGPERLVAEVPRGLSTARQLLLAAGYRHEADRFDHIRRPAPVEPVPGGWLLPITVDELDGLGLLEDALPDGGMRAWERSVATLRARRDELVGFAVASAERVEAFALAAPAALPEIGVSRCPDGSTNGPADTPPDEPAALDVLALGGPAGEQLEVFQGVLLRHLAATTHGTLRLPKLAPGEVAPAVLEGLGFVPAGVWEHWVGRAIPG